MPFVTDIDKKLESVKRHLGFTTDKQLAYQLHIDPSNFPKWKHNVPDKQVNNLAKLVGTTDKLFIERTGEEFAAWLEQRQATSHVWDALLKHANANCINIVRIDQPMVELIESMDKAYRKVLIEDNEHPLPPEGVESFKINERIYLNVTLPSNYFKQSSKFHALLLCTDPECTAFLTPPTQPIPIRASKAQVSWPDNAPQRRLTLRNPPGEHLFTAIFLKETLSELDSELTGKLEQQQTLTHAQLNEFAECISSREPGDWLISTKRFYVVPR